MLLLPSSLATALVAGRRFSSVHRSWLLVQLCNVHPFHWLNSSLEDWSQGTGFYVAFDNKSADGICKLWQWSQYVDGTDLAVRVLQISQAGPIGHDRGISAVEMPRTTTNATGFSGCDDHWRHLLQLLARLWLLLPGSQHNRLEIPYWIPDLFRAADIAFRPRTSRVAPMVGLEGSGR